MAKLLYEKETTEEIVPNITRNGVVISEEEMYEAAFKEDIKSLENHTEAFISVSTVCEHLSEQPLNFLDKSNCVLYNEYIRTITSNVGATAPILYISEEAMAYTPSVAGNRRLALEGFVGDMWEKIKAIFKKIYDTIKKFFAGIFTRVGRAKKKLDNLETVLSKTDKDLKQVHVENITSGLDTLYPVSDNITYVVVTAILGTSINGINALKSISENAKKLASHEVLDSEFVAEIKTLTRSTAEGVTESKEESSDDKSMKDVKEDKTSTKSESEAIKIGDKLDNKGVDVDGVGEEKALAAFTEFMNTVKKDLDPLTGKPLANGRVISNIEVEKESGITLTIDVVKETPTGINLADRSELIKLIKSSKEALSTLETLSKTYVEINDSIMSNLDKVDKITKDIDAIKIESLGKYKSVLQKKVKIRLNYMKNFFKGYNEVNKNLYSLALDSIEGNIKYTLVSLKYFG